MNENGMENKEFVKLMIKILLAVVASVGLLITLLYFLPANKCFFSYEFSIISIGKWKEQITQHWFFFYHHGGFGSHAYSDQKSRTESDLRQYYGIE